MPSFQKRKITEILQIVQATKKKKRKRHITVQVFFSSASFEQERLLQRR